MTMGMTTNMIMIMVLKNTNMRKVTHTTIHIRKKVEHTSMNMIMNQGIHTVRQEESTIKFTTMRLRNHLFHTKKTATVTSMIMVIVTVMKAATSMSLVLTFMYLEICS